MFNRRDVISVLIIWAALTIVGELFAYIGSIYPIATSELAQDVDDAFRLLMLMGIPVFTFVVTVLGYSIIAFRRSGPPTEDGPTVHNHRGVAWGWFGITTALTVAVIINPGLTGLSELNAERHEDMVIEVTAAQWNWNFTFPEQDVQLSKVKDLKLPVNTRIRFDVTSRDVLHALWLPSYRMKIDAVPGTTNSVYISTDELTSYAENPTVRIQCAELCGTGHARMQVRLAVVEQDEFDTWLSAEAAAQ